MKNISKHISYREATKSRTAQKLGIYNIPTDEELKSMEMVAEKCFEPVRKAYGEPIGISSFYRCYTLNKALGGSRTSQHVKGEAIDIDADIFDNGITNADIFTFIKKHCDFTQLIWEFGNDKEPSWVHVSYDSDNLKRQILKAINKNGKTRYINYGE